MKDFTLYPEALALRELGFDEFCFGYFRDGKLSGVNKWDRKDWEFHIISNKDITNITHEIVLAPTYSQAFRFFREKYGLQCWPEPTGSGRYCCKYDGNDETGRRWVGYLRNNNKEILFHPTYEEAELACLQKLIEIVKSQYEKNINTLSDISNDFL